MANPNIRVDVDGNTAKLRRQIDQVAKQGVSLNIQTAGGAAQPLGKISGQIQEIDKSLAAANARVIAFAASAGAIYAIQNAVTSLFNTFVNVEKKLADVNVLLNLTDRNLAKFGASLFDIAGNTAQSFDVVAEAATELSRQGLGVEETLKRTEAALILTRLSGLDAAASVSALTAAINSFGGSALQATEIVNKLANVDAAFAVSSADLANALSRVGSSADDAGISFDELIALVTTAQQVTARGGAVIGNSLKTIFTRLGREKTQEVLGGLGIQSTDAEGNVKTQVQLLKELASVYDGLSATQKNYVAEQVGGVFQINVLKAALGDLGKEYSIYDQALKTSLGTTDQAIRRNEKLNETLSARGTRALANIQQAGGNIAGGLFEPAAKNVLNISEFLTGAVNNVDADSIGAKIGSGIISGIGNFIGGPGLALVTAAVVKLFAEFSRYGVEAFKSILGVNQAAKEQAVIQQSVVKFLQNNASIYKAISSGQASVASGAKAYLEIVKQQTIELQKQNSIAAQIAKTTASQVGVQNVGGKSFITQRGSKVKTAAGGFLPHLAAEQNNINNRVGDANPAKDRPVVMKNFPMGNNKKGTMVAHTGEWAVSNYGGGDGTAIWNREMKSKYGLPDGAKKISASGHIPNFAKPKNKKSLPGGTITGAQSSQVANKGLDTYSPFSFDIISIGNRSSFENQFDKQLNNLNSKDSKLSEAAVKYFARNGYSIKQISQLKQNLLTNKEKVPSLLSGNKKLVNKDRQFTGVKNDLVGKYFERFAANRLGLQLANSKTARMDLLNSKGNPVAEVKFGTIDNDNLISKVIETNYGKSKKQNPPQEDNIFMPSNYKLVVPNAASGFIPNFAQTKEVTDLGDTRTSKLLNNKVVSLIYPQVSEGYSMMPGVGNYLNKTYKGLIPVAGINKDVIKGELPDLQKNLGELLVREANQFGQAVGGKNFLNSAKELPNYGAAEGAVGVAFEGGLLTLLKKDLQKTSQNAGIDFRQDRITPKLRNLFHGAPGMYDAKSSSGAVNEVMQKLLNEAKPGAVKQVRSGSGFGNYQKLREQALKNLAGQSLRRGPQKDKAIEAEMARLSQAQSAAGGFIPNFVNIQAIQELMKRGATLGERSAAQSALARIQQGSLLKLGTSDKLNKFKELLYGSKSNAGFNLDAIKMGDLKYKPLVQGARELGLSDRDLQSLASSPMAIKELRNYNQNIRKTSDTAASGFIPNFAKSDQYVKEVIALEESISGKKAVIDDKPFLHIRNKSQPSFASAMRQHGGKNRAMKDSAEMQKGAGLLASSGFIPNFAVGDNETNFTSGATDFTAISASISGLLFSLAFFGGQLDDGAKELRKLKGELKSTGQTLDQAFESNQQRINRQNKLLQKLDVQENTARQNPTLYNAQAGTWTDTGMAGQIEREKRRERVARDQARSEERAATIQSAINKRSLTKRERFDEFARNKGLGLGFALQTASGIGSQIAGGDQTVAGSLLTGLGNIGGFAGAGAAVGGGAPGAIIGGIVGAALSAKPIVDALALSINGLGDASQRVQKATENAQRAQESTQGLLIAREKLSDLTESNAPIKDITRAENEYLRQLSKLPPSIQNQISATNDVVKQQEILAKYIQDQTRGANIESLTTDIGTTFIKSIFNIGKQQSKQIAGAVASNFNYAGGEDVDTAGRIQLLDKLIASLTDAETRIEQFKFETPTEMDAANQIFDNILSILKEGGEGSAEELKKLQEAFKNAKPSEIRQVILDLLANYQDRKKENENTLKLEEQSRKNLSQLPKVIQDYISNFRKNKNALDNSAKLIGNLNKILKIDIPKFNLGLASQTDAAVMQYRAPSFEQEAAMGAARIDQQSYIDFIEASKEAADTLKGSFVPQLQDNIRNADLTTSANRGEVVDLQNVSEQIAKAVTIEDIQKIDLSKLPKGLQDAYEKSLEDANFNLKQALQNIDFNNAAQKVQQAFDIAVGRFNDRMQKMQGYAGGVSGLSGFDPTQMEGTELRRAYQAGEIGPLKYKREMDKFEREQSIRRLEAMEALGIPENYQRGERSRLTAMLQDQSDEYLDAIGLGNLKGLGRANVVDMVNQQFGGMKPGQKFANPFNQAAEDLVKSIGYMGINMDKFSQQAFTGLQKEADNAAEKLLNLANCAQTAINALCPSTSGGAFGMQAGGGKTNPPITSSAAANAIKSAMQTAGAAGAAGGGAGGQPFYTIKGLPAMPAGAPIAGGANQGAAQPQQQVQQVAAQISEEAKKAANAFLEFNKSGAISNTYKGAQPDIFPAGKATQEQTQERQAILDAFKKIISVPEKTGQGEPPVILPATLEESLNSLLTTGKTTPSQQSVLLPELNRLFAEGGPSGQKIAQDILKNIPKMGPNFMQNFGIGGSTKEQGYMGEPAEAWVGKYTKDFTTVLKSLAYPESPVATSKEKYGVMQGIVGMDLNRGKSTPSIAPNKEARKMLEEVLNVNKDLTLSTEEIAPYGMMIQNMGEMMLGQYKVPQGTILPKPGFSLPPSTSQQMPQQPTYPVTIPQSSYPLNMSSPFLGERPYNYQNQFVDPKPSLPANYPMQIPEKKMPLGPLSFLEPDPYPYKPEQRPPIKLEKMDQPVPAAPPQNIEQGKVAMDGLKQALDSSRQAVDKNSGKVEDQTRKVEEAPRKEEGQQQGQGEGRETTLNQDISFPVDISTDFKIDVSMSEEAIAEVGAKISEVQEQLRAELASAIDAVNRQIAGLQTKNGQTA
jgi:TP901 family phage tail tape measure protein